MTFEIIQELQNDALLAKSQVFYGTKTKEEVREVIMLWINAFNKKSREISKKLHITPKTISFESFIRF